MKIFGPVVFILCLLAPHSSQAYTKVMPSTTLLGSVARVIGDPKVSQRNVAVPDLVAYYKGTKIDITHGKFSLKEHVSLDHLYMLFTVDPIFPQPTNDEDRNTITHFCMKASSFYKCFKVDKNPAYWSTRYIPTFNKANCPQQFKDAWIVEHIKLPVHHQKILLPENTLIVLVHPKYVSSLEQEIWDCEMNTIKLPKIMLKDVHTVAIADHVHAESLLAAIDMDPFHRKPTVIKATAPDKPHVVLAVTTE